MCEVQRAQFLVLLAVCNVRRHTKSQKVRMQHYRYRLLGHSTYGLLQMLRHYTPRGKLHYANQLEGLRKATEYSKVELRLTQYKHMNQAGNI